MKSRRLIQLSQEGWYYSFVLAFVMTGAILRQINPLFILSGLMFAPLVINWRLAMSMLRAIDIKRRYPNLVSAGQKFSVELHVHNRLRRLDCWNINLIDLVQSGPSDGALLTRAALKKLPQIEVPFRNIPAEGTAVQSYQCQFNQRGVHRLGPLWATTRYPLGLVSAKQQHRCVEEIIVAPRVGILTPAWQKMLNAPMIGSGRGASRHSSSEGEFFALRTWRSGDSRRWIHWRTSAKLGQIAIRQFEQRVDRSITLLLDFWQPENPSEADLDAVELAASLVATAMQATGDSVSRIMVAIADQGSHIFRSSSGRSQSEVLKRLALAVPSARPETGKVLEQLCANLGGPTSLLVVSTRDLQQVPNLESTHALGDGNRELSRLVWMNVRDKEVEQLIQFNGERDSLDRSF